MFYKQKSILAFLLVIGINVFSYAQNFNTNEPIAVYKKVKKGVLPNGMTYYIYPTEVNKNTASYYIIQNVGSILENDQQKGLAHFLEHMAFNGTKHFEGKGILNTLQKQGAIFGRNINAYTNTDETVYNLDNIPSKDAGVVDTCLLVLHDWSSFLSLTDEEIDAERGVITEEWRTRQSARARIFDQISPYYYNNCLYAERTPIGDMNIIKNFKYQALKDFYKDWYRPDLQAIAIVGDINADEIEAKIKKLFADIPTPQNPKKRFEVSIPEKAEPVYKLALDKEISASSINYIIRHKAKKPTQTYTELEKTTQYKIAFAIINNRLREMAQKQDCSFKGAQIAYQKLTRLNDIWALAISPKPGRQAEAFTAVMNEWVRAYKFGFSKGEIERAANEETSVYENYVEKMDEISHKDIISMVKDNYLKQDVIGDPQPEFDMVKNVLKNINTEALQEQLVKLYTPQNRVVTVTGVEGEENLTQEQAFAAIQKVENDASLQPYVDTFVAKSLMDETVVKPGKIVSEKNAKEIASTTYTLSNGAKVHYKFADKNKKEVELRAESYGGASLYEPNDIPSILRTASLAMMSGVGELSNTDLDKVLKGKNASCSVNINSLKETVYGSANVKDIETMMQLVHLRFTKPRFDNQMFALLKQRLENTLKNKGNDINAKMGDSLIAIMYGKDNPKFRVIDQQFINDLSFDKMKSFYLDRFADISNFEFYIVGDVTPEVLKPLLEKYIASIEGVKRKENFKIDVTGWTSNKIDRDVYLKMETPKSSVRIAFADDYAYNQKNKILTSFLGDILVLRYTESLREKEGGTYGARVEASLDKLPVSKATLNITFDCDAEKVEKLLPIVYEEIDNIKKGKIALEDLEKTRTSYFKSREDSKNFNSYSMSLIYNYFENNYNMNDPKNYETIVKSITAKDIEEFANSMLNKADAMEVVFKPLK